MTVRIEDANVTARALVHGVSGIDGWVTFDPWPAMTNVLANRDVTKTPTPLASSDLIIAFTGDEESGGSGIRKMLEEHPAWIDVTGFQWGLSQETLPGPGGTLAPGTPSVQAAQFTQPLSRPEEEQLAKSF